MSEKKKIGFIGIGKMGNPMAKRLLQAGYQLTVWNRTKEKTKEVVDMGAKLAASPAEAASESDVVFIAVLGGPELEAVTLGDEGALAGAKPNSIFVDIVTAEPESSVKVAKVAEQKKVRYLRAPVTGSTVLASQGTIGFIVSGDKAAYEEVLPILQGLGNKFFHVGTKEEAKYLKLVMNLMLGCYAQLMAEALTIAERAGLDWKTTLEVVNASVAANPFFGYKVKPLLERNFTPAFTVMQMHKDLDLALGVGKSLGVPLPVVALVRQIYEAAAATGKANLDVISLLLLEEELAGIKKD